MAQRRLCQSDVPLHNPRNVSQCLTHAMECHTTPPQLPTALAEFQTHTMTQVTGLFQHPPRKYRTSPVDLAITTSTQRRLAAALGQWQHPRVDVVCTGGRR